MSNLISYSQKFKTVKSCLKKIESIRWKDGVFCPHCGSTRKIYHYSDSIRHRCGDCTRVFRITVGTIFTNSPIKMLPQWFIAIYLVTSHKKGISSYQLGRDIGVTQKTAWFMLHRIRNAAKNIGMEELLGNDVETDETYIAGKEKNKHSVAFGIKQRKGNVKAFHVPGAGSSTVLPLMIRNVALGSSVNADDHRGYSTLDDIYKLSRVNHSKGEYKRGNCHTNSIESVWALLKRGYVGIYHHWSKKHTQRYLDEFVFRLNTKKVSEGERASILLNGGMFARLSYKDLIA